MDGIQSGKSIRNTGEMEEENRSGVTTNSSLIDRASSSFRPKCKSSISSSENTSAAGWLRLSTSFFNSQGSIEPKKKRQTIEIELLRDRLRKVDASLVETMDVNQETQAKLIQETICEGRKSREKKFRIGLQLDDQTAKSPSDKYSRDEKANCWKELLLSRDLKDHLDNGVDLANNRIGKSKDQLDNEDVSNRAPSFENVIIAEDKRRTISQRGGIQARKVLTNKADTVNLRTLLDEQIPTNLHNTCLGYLTEDTPLSDGQGISTPSEGSTPLISIQSNKLQEVSSISKSKTFERKLHGLERKNDAEKNLLMDLVLLALADSHDLHLNVEIPEKQVERDSIMTEQIEESITNEIVRFPRKEADDQLPNTQFGRNHQELTAKDIDYTSTADDNVNILSAVGAWLTGSTSNESPSDTSRDTLLKNTPTRAVGDAHEQTDAKPSKTRCSEGASPIKNVFDALSGWLSISPQDHEGHQAEEYEPRETNLVQGLPEGRSCQQQSSELQGKFQTSNEKVSSLERSKNDTQGLLSIDYPSSKRPRTEFSHGSRQIKRARLLARAERNQPQDKGNWQ